MDWIKTDFEFRRSERRRPGRGAPWPSAALLGPSRLASRGGPPPGSGGSRRRTPGHSTVRPSRSPMPTSATALKIPEDLKPADGRFGCGPVEGPPRAARRAWPRRARRVMGTSHRQKPVKDARRRACASGLRELFALPDGYEVALGNGGTTAFWDAAAVRPRPRARAAPDASASSPRSSPTVTQGAPFLGDPIVVERRRPATRPRRPRDAERRRRRLGAQRDLDRRDGRRVDRRAGDGARADRRHLGRRRPAGRRRARPTSTTSRRRSASPPTAACGSRC